MGSCLHHCMVGVGAPAGVAGCPSSLEGVLLLGLRSRQGRPTPSGDLWGKVKPTGDVVSNIRATSCGHGSPCAGSTQEPGAAPGEAESSRRLVKPESS